MAWDAFISYASEDREEVAQPLYEKLNKYGLKIWYDKFELRIGDALREKIDTGLASSKYGIIILSKNYFSKPWPKMELEGLIQKEVGGITRILPVWHNIEHDEILQYSPILAGKYAGKTKHGIDVLVDDLLPIITQTPSDSNERAHYSVIIAYKKIIQSQELHRYSLVFDIKLNTPPSITGYKLILLWPEIIRINNSNNLILKRSLVVNSLRYIEFNVEDNVKIYPGERVGIISPEGKSLLEYDFDNNIFYTVHSRDVFLFWQLFIHDQMPIEGKKNFMELNIY
jgi:hypothetical protein